MQWWSTVLHAVASCTLVVVVGGEVLQAALRRLNPCSAAMCYPELSTLRPCTPFPLDNTARMGIYTCHE